MTTSKKTLSSRNYGLLAFVYGSVGLFTIVLLLGPSSDLGARVALAGVGVLSAIVGIWRSNDLFRENKIYHPESHSTFQVLLTWFRILMYASIGIAIIILAFSYSFD